MQVQGETDAKPEPNRHTRRQRRRSVVNSIIDPLVADLLAHVHVEAEVQRSGVREQIASLAQMAPGPQNRLVNLKDFYLPVSREQGTFLYQTVRAIGARRVVEFGSSFGVSTVYLAAGLRDNGDGVVVASEAVAERIDAARKNLAAAGLGEFVELRTGDARAALADPGGPIDLLLLDGAPGTYLEILRLLTPHLRVGAVVIADNIAEALDDPHPYARWVRDPSNGFVSNSITVKNDTEYSVWVGKPGDDHRQPGTTTRS